MNDLYRLLLKIDEDKKNVDQRYQEIRRILIWLSEQNNNRDKTTMSVGFFLNGLTAGIPGAEVVAKPIRAKNSNPGDFLQMAFQVRIAKKVYRVVRVTGTGRLRWD